MSVSKKWGDEAGYSMATLHHALFKREPCLSADTRFKLLSRYTNRLWQEGRTEELQAYHAYRRLIDKLNRARYHQMLSTTVYYGEIGSAREVSTKMIIKTGKHKPGEVYNPCHELLVLKSSWEESVTTLADYAFENRCSTIRQYDKHDSVIASAAMWLNTICYSDYEVFNILSGRFSIDVDILKSYYQFGYVAYGVDGCIYVAKGNFKTKDGKPVYGLVLEVFEDDYTEVLIPLLSSYDI